MKKLWTLLFLLCALSASARQRTGKVVAVEGSAKAGVSEKQERKLSRGSPIFTEEIIAVGRGSKVQIQFTDGALLNLTPKTAYRVNAYSYGDKRDRDQYSGELLKGGFRHLTGKIAKDNPDAVEIATPNATIGVRGTVIEALFTTKGELFIGCQHGLVSVSNTEGSLALGPLAPYQFLDVSNMDAPPQGLTTKPAALESVDFSSPSGGVPTTSTGFVETGGVTIQGGC